MGERWGVTKGGRREFRWVQVSAVGPQKSTCLPAAPGLWRAAGGGGDRVPGVEGLASPSPPPQPRGEGLHRWRLQGAAAASCQPPTQVPNPDPWPFTLGHADLEGLRTAQGNLRARGSLAGLSSLHFLAGKTKARPGVVQRVSPRPGTRRHAHSHAFFLSPFCRGGS